MIYCGVLPYERDGPPIQFVGVEFEVFENKILCKIPGVASLNPDFCWWTDRIKSPQEYHASYRWLVSGQAGSIYTILLPEDPNERMDLLAELLTGEQVC